VSARRTLTALLIAVLAGFGCGGAPVGAHGVDLGPGSPPKGNGVPKAKAAPRETPPPSAPSKEAPFPATARATLPNGMGIDVVTSRALPIVQVRLLVRAGSGYGPLPGVAEVTAQMLKDGGTRAMTSGEVLRRVETLGADLGVRQDFDTTVLSLAVTKDQLAEGLSLLSQVVREPRFDGEELKRLKKRLADEAEDTARSSGSWTASWILFRELFAEKHPYATFGPLPAQIAKVDGLQVRDFHRRFFVPKAATLVLAGDVDEATAKELAGRHFGPWVGGAGGDPPKIDFAAPRAPDRTRVFVAHRPKSVQSDVYVAMLAPERRAERWPQVRVANQILGGGVASRLFADVREQRSLAYRTNASILELAHGQQPLVVYAGTESGKTTQALAGLLENVAKMTSSPPTAQETETARRYLADVFAIRMETIGSIAEMVVTQETLGLPERYWDTYRRELRATTPDQAAEAAKTLYAGGKVLVAVAGDADVIATDLARFGEVTVVDPEKEFKVLRTVPGAAK
jgi:zinc protease